MAVTWKEVALADNVPNLGNSDLTQNEPNTNVNRKYTLEQYDGGGTDDTHSRSLDFRWKSRDGSTGSLLKLQTGHFYADGSDAVNTALTVNAKTQNYTASDNITFSAAGNLIFQGANETLVYATEFTILDYLPSASEGPVLNLKRNPLGQHDGDDGDILGVIKFTGENDANGEEEYASINTKILDASAGSEDGEMDIKLMNAGYSLSALKILPETSPSLDALLLYGDTLESLINAKITAAVNTLTTANTYTSLSRFKMYCKPQNTYGFDEGNGYLMTHGYNSGSTLASDDDNQTLRLTSNIMNNLVTGGTSISASSGDGFIDTNIGDNNGRGDTWISYEHAHSSPDVRVRISGNLWWKPKSAPPAGGEPKISVFMIRAETATGALTDINAANGLLFSNYQTSPTYTLSDGLEISKVSFSFDHSISATTGSGDSKTYMYMLGMKVVSLTDHHYLGQASTSSQTNNDVGMVADVALAVTPQ